MLQKFGKPIEVFFSEFDTDSQPTHWYGKILRGGKCHGQVETFKNRFDPIEAFGRGPSSSA